MISEPMVRPTQTVHPSCIRISTISKRTELSLEPRHLEVPLGVSEMIYELMVRLAQTDEDINTTPTPTPLPAPLCPITRARARQLNHQVSSFLNSCPSYLDNGDRALLFYLGMMERIRRAGDWRRLDLDCRTAPTCDGCHDFIRTPIVTF
jgi:hypothetical protein